MIKKFIHYLQIEKLMITENGAAFPDELISAELNAKKIKQFIIDNLAQILKAKNEGYNKERYFVWTLTDNFEWAEGYHSALA